MKCFILEANVWGILGVFSTLEKARAEAKRMQQKSMIRLPDFRPRIVIHTAVMDDPPIFSGLAFRYSGPASELVEVIES